MGSIDQTAQSLYHRFSTWQLRELALASKVSSDKIAELKSKGQVLAAIDSLSDRHRLALLAHRVETLSPYKHCVLLEPCQPIFYREVLSSCRAAFSELFVDFVPLQSDATELSIQLCIDDEASQRIFIKFAHMVEVWEARKTDVGDILRSKVWRRHILVAEINVAIQVVSIGFPGFTQSVESSDKVSYNIFAMQVVEIIKTKLALELTAFPLKPTTDLLVQDQSEGVVDLKRTLRFERGGKMDLDSESDKDAASALANGLASTGVVISAEAIRTAFRASEAQSIVLLWQKQRLLTRLSMRHSLPELLFIWDEAEPSLSLVDEILGKLARVRTSIGSDGLLNARRSIAETLEADSLSL